MNNLLKRALIIAALFASAGSALAQYQSPMQQAIVRGDKKSVQAMLQSGYNVDSFEEITSAAPLKKKYL